jgi:4-hydroxyphenylpyruvate dioxygenase
MSLGRAWVHELPQKLDQAAKQHYAGIEVFYEDLEHAAKSLPGGLTTTNLLIAACEVRRLCDAGGLEIICLQPFLFYEGLRDRTEHTARIEKLQVWFRIARELGTDIIQIPSNFMPAAEITGDFDVIVADMREVADLGLQQDPVVRFVYEPLCWGTYVDTWEDAWNIVAAVDRPNFGICLDTFNIAGREWADPANPDGKITGKDVDEALRRSLEKLKRTVDVKKVFYIQVVDAEKMRYPLVPGHAFYAEGQPPRMSWSRNARLFPFEGGYLPVLEVLKAITDAEDGLGYKGWISLELFSRTMADPSPSCAAEHARRGMESWKKLVQAMNWTD